MRRILISIILFSAFFMPVLKVNAIDTVETLNVINKEIEDVQNGPINESTGFANIVIFIKFADESSYSAPHDYDYYESLFNDEVNASLKSYYEEVSYDQLTIDSYIVNDGATMIYYQDINNRGYYEIYDASTNPLGYEEDDSDEAKAREHGLLKRAIDYVEANNLVSDSIDLDVNADGDIDSITFAISGEDDGWNTLLWPHKWNLSTYYNYSNGTFYAEAPVINGLNAYVYTLELLGNSVDYGIKIDVGVVAHETFHLISAPDLYHYYGYDHINPVGDWGLMDSTSPIPSHMLGYMKEMYGNWISSVDVISESGTYTLAPMADSPNNLYKIDLGYSNEFVYLEYRDAVGTFESNLPGSGLLVYRVDMDYYDKGNELGYYDSQGNPIDELFVFRPGISNTPLPIFFPEIDDEEIDEDGEIDDAALSNNNLYSEMGNDTDITMFYSDGSLMDIKIFNVVEHDGVITFDVYLPPSIDLISEIDIPEDTLLYLFDGSGFSYRMEINNIASNALVYYTLDGSEPSTSSTLYTGGTINFDASSSLIKANVYVDGILIGSLSEQFNFVSEIETAHDPYGDMQNISWYLDLENDVSEYNLLFSGTSSIEPGYDFVYIYDSLGETVYTGVEITDLDLIFDEDIVIQFESDEDVDEYYGIYVEIDLLIDISVDLIGESIINIEVFDDYTELGAVLSGDDAGTHTYEIVGTVDTSTLGIYTITYNVLNESLAVVKSTTRTINIIDTEAPEVSFIGDSEINIEVFSTYTDLGVTYSDNLDTTLDYDYTNNVNTNILGTYTVEYTVTDLSGNSTTVERTVNVIDSESPTATLLAGVDTIFVGDEHILESIEVLDNYYTEFDITVVNNVNIEVAGIYLVEYTVKDGSLNEIVIHRYVNVINKEIEVIFTLGKTLNTIKIGKDFNSAGCTVSTTFNDSGYSCTLDISAVDTSKAGTYEVIYFVVIDEVRYELISYVFVYDGSDVLIWHYDKSRRGYL